MGGFSQQDLQDLDEIAKRLPANDPRVPRIRGAITGQQSQPAPEKPGLLKSLSSDLLGMIPTTPKEYGRSLLRVVPGANSLMDALETPQRVEHYQEQKKEGYGLGYRALTPVAEGVGVNVRGMEDSAKQGDEAGVYGHALAVPTAMAIGAGVAKGAPAIRSGAASALKIAPEVIDPEITGIFSPRLAHLQKVAGKLGKAITPKPTAPPIGAPQLEAPMSPAAQQLQSRIGIERGLQAQEPFPRLSEGLPEVEEGQGTATAHLHKAIPVNEMGNARMELTPRRVPGEIAPEQVAVRPGRSGTISARPIPARPGLLLKGDVEPVYPGAPQPQATPELLQSRPLAIGARTPPPDQSANLGSIPVKTGPQPAPITRARVGDLLDQATGGKSLAPSTPLRQQLDRITPAPRESSVIKSHSYDPNAKEITVTTHAGQTYTYGDVSPEQAAEFENGSKGQAWGRLQKSSSVLVKKNGKPVTPSASKSASPDDLTPILEESVKKAKAKK